jgi:hypothetical protein
MPSRVVDQIATECASRIQLKTDFFAKISKQQLEALPFSLLKPNIKAKYPSTLNAIDKLGS